MSPRAAITAVFFVNGALFASWVSRIPALSDRVGATTGELGLALLAPAVGAVVAMPLAGFAALGLGLAGVVPTLFRAGAGEPGVSTGPALAVVSSLGYLGFLAGPPLIGGVAQLTSLRLACGLLALAGLLVVVLAPSAEVRRPRAATAQPSFTT